MAEEEKQYVPKKYKRKHMWWRYGLVFLGGVLFTAVGSAAAGAIYSTQIPVSQVVGLLPSELSKYLTYFTENENDTLYSAIMNFIYDGENALKGLLSGIELPDIITTDMVGEGLQYSLCYYDASYIPEEKAEEPAVSTFTLNENEHPINLYMLINGAIPTAVEGKTITFVDNLMSRLCISYIMDIDEDSPMNALADTPLNKISEKFDNLKIEKVIKIGKDSSKLLKAIEGTTIKDLSTKLSQLKLGDVINLENCDGLAKGILTQLKDSLVNDLDTEFNKVLLTKAFESEIYEEDGVTMKSQWKYMLYQDISVLTDSTKKAEQEDNFSKYTLKDFSKMTTNMTNNMKVATLGQLKADEFIGDSVTDEMLGKTIPGQTKKIGEMTLTELIVVVAATAS